MGGTLGTDDGGRIRLDVAELQWSDICQTADLRRLRRRNARKSFGMTVVRQIVSRPPDTFSPTPGSLHSPRGREMWEHSVACSEPQASYLREGHLLLGLER